MPHARAALLAVVALFATNTLASIEYASQKYATTVKKGLANASLNKHLGPYYMRSGQCTGQLDTVLVCLIGPLLAVEVTVEDAMPYPNVVITDDLQRVQVVRAPPCLGEAHVYVQLACHAYPQPEAHD